MGTLLEVRVPDLPPGEAVEAIRCVRRRVEEIEAALTLYRPRSPLVAFNASAPGSWQPVPAILGEALRASHAAWITSGGAFDPTVAVAMRAQGLLRLEGGRADTRLLDAWRSRPGPGALEIAAGDERARRLDPRIEIDLGGLGKGIGVDAALAELTAHGSRASLVNLGGSIGVLAAPAGTSGWSIGLAHPRKPGALWSEFTLAHGHLATSGDYERWVETPEGRKHHLLDPESGEPASGVASLTAWAPSGAAADLASTAWFVDLSRGTQVLTGAFLAIRDGGERLGESVGPGWRLGGRSAAPPTPKKT